MTVAVAGRPCFDNSCKINHLGINPVRGGRPARDRRTRAVVAERIGPFDQAVTRVLIFVVASALNVKNAADVIKI